MYNQRRNSTLILPRTLSPSLGNFSFFPETLLFIGTGSVVFHRVVEGKLINPHRGTLKTGHIT